MRPSQSQSLRMLFRKLIFSILLCASPLTLAQNSNDASDQEPKSVGPKNVIFLMGDGLGPTQIKALRYYNDNPATPTLDPLSFDPYFQGVIATDSLPKKGKDKPDHFYITDSAAAATAYATGQKTFNYAISVDINREPIETVYEVAKAKGMKTGLVATSQITHATPAAYVAHVDFREKYDEIANAFLDNKINGQPIVDLFLGGGMDHFARKDRDLISELKTEGYTVIDNAAQLNSLPADKNQRVAGLFAPLEIPKVLDRRAKHPSLKQMAEVALNRLDTDSENGFMLLIEGSQIDWSGHDNDVVGMVHELQDFYDAVNLVLERFKDRDDTLIILTGDHETGGFSPGLTHDNVEYYEFNVAPIRKFTKSIPAWAIEITDTRDMDPFLELLGIEFTKEEKYLWREIRRKSSEYYVMEFLKDLVDRTTYSGWTTTAHTGIDVFIYAKGPLSEKFQGYNDNTIVGQVLLDWLKNSK